MSDIFTKLRYLCAGIKACSLSMKYGTFLRVIAVSVMCCALLAGTASAQGTTGGGTQGRQQATPGMGVITGTITGGDSATPLIGTTVELTPKGGAPADKKVMVSGEGGRFAFRDIKYGVYTVKITHLGYGPWTKEVTLNSSVERLQVKLKEAVENIQEVVVDTYALRTSQKGDTLVYNANSFKVSKDSDTETLISKMPGITVGTDGKVEAQGEQVKKVLVDGREFFGDDVTSAIRNLPAEAVAKIEVFNKLSDQAQFTGVDDGEGVKAINIVTKPNMRNGQFGRIYAGYGYDDKYIAGGNVNIFKGDSRISLIGMANNINQQNFSTDDILGVVGSGSGSGRGRGGQGGRRGGGGGGGGYRRNDAGDFMVGAQNGVSTVGSFGVNYTDKWGKKVEAQASYFFNTTDNYNRTLTDREYFLGDNSVQKQLYRDTTINRSTNYNHRFNAKIDYKINDNNSIMIRPQASVQSYSRRGSSDGMNMFQDTDGSTELLNILKDISKSKNSGYNMSIFTIYRHKFGNSGRNMTVDFSANKSKNDGTSYQDTEIEYFNPAKDSLLRQDLDNNTNSYRLGGSVMYSEPLSKVSQLNLSYRINYNYSDVDRKSYLWNVNDQQYDFNSDLSNTYNSGYLTHRVGPGYRLNNEKATVVANVYYQRATLQGDQTYPAITSPEMSAEFNNVVYMGMLHYRFSKTRSIRMFLRSYTNNPSVKQLQDVLDISNPLSVSVGNKNLDPVYANMGHFHYVSSNVDKGTTFMVMGGVTNQMNYIANDVIIAETDGTVVPVDGHDPVVLSRGAQFSQPVNMDGYWNAQAGISYGMPIKPVKCNFNMLGRVAYTGTPSILNGVTNKTNTITYTAGLVLGSNISEKVDFTLMYDAGYNTARNSVRKEANNDYFNQVARGRFKIEVWKGFTVQGDATYSFYRGITDTFTQDILLCNAFIGKKFLKNKRAEITVGVYDIFDQNKSFARNVTDTYIENVTSNTMGRYWGINLSYNLRNFKVAKK